MSKELQVTETTQAKPLATFGVETGKRTEAANLLQESMGRKKKKIFFNNKEYAEFHDLQVVSNYFGHSIRTYDAQAVEVNGVKGFKAHADLINKDGISIGGAEAYCLQDEPNWARKPLFQLASMAQTRAASKCITNVYRWVLDLAGYGTTAAEEISDLPSSHTSPALPAPTEALQSAQITITELKDYVVKTGKNAGSVYYRIIDEKTNAYTVFDKPLIEMAKTMVGQEVSVSFKEDKFGKTVKDISPL